MILDRGCFERGCACYDERVDKDGIEVVKKEWVGLTDEEKEKYVVAYFVDKYDRETAVTLMNDYEAVLKEKNSGQVQNT